MKRKFNIALLLILSIIILFTVTVSSQTITQQQAIEDLTYLVDRLEEVHPNIYYHLNKKKAEQKIAEVKSKLNKKDKWTSKEIYRLFAPFVASFKDGHTLISYKVEQSKLNETEKLIPLAVRIIDGKVLIYKSYTVREIKKGTELLEVNGIKIDKILNKMESSVSSENRNLAYARIEKSFPIYLWLLYDFKDNYQIKIKDNIQNIRDLNLQGIKYKIYSVQKEKKENKNWTLEFPVKDTAYLTIITFNGSLKNAFERDMVKYFKEIKERYINNLFIDISENGGGNTDLAKYLFEYISDKTYSLFKEVRMKYSDYALKDRTNMFTKLYYTFKKDRDNIIVFKSDKVVPKENDLRFKGNIYVITSDFTFSTATDFAAIVKDHKVGTIIGEETGGLASCYGDMIVGNLPNSNLPFGVSYKYFLRPAGFDDGGGVKPDIKIDISELKYWYTLDSYKNMIIKSIIY